MKPKEFQKLLERDGGRCYHCGATGDTLVPQHRLNRGMGGSKLGNRSANLITFCSKGNGDLESSALFASMGLLYGWKLRSGDDPITAPVFEFWSKTWWLLSDDGQRKSCDSPTK